MQNQTTVAAMLSHPFVSFIISVVWAAVAWVTLDELRSVFGLIAVIVSAAAGVISGVGGVLKIVDWVEKRKQTKNLKP